MQGSIGSVDIVVIVLMMVISAAIGIYFHFTGGRQKTINEFLMGGKEMKIFPVSLSLMATVMSAISILGIPAETYMYGTQNIILVIGFLLAGPICAWGILPVYFELNIDTAYEYLEKRFGKTTRTIAAALFIVKMIFNTAIVLYAPSIALNTTTGMSIWIAIISTAAVSTFYCTLGGLKAVLWTDVFQSALMYVTLFAVILIGSHTIGFTKVFSSTNEGGRLVFFNMNTDMTERYTFWNALCLGTYMGLYAFCGNQSEIQRILSVGNLKKGQMSVIFGAVLIVTFYILCFWCGIVLYAIYRNCDPMLDSTSHLNSPDEMMPYTMLKFFKDLPGLSGLCIAGIFSGALSSISSMVNSMTSVTVEDFLKSYCRYKCLTESVIVGLAKCLVIVYGCLCLLLTYMVANFRGVIEASIIMNGLIGGPVLGVFLLGIFTKTANQQGILTGLAAGIAFSTWVGVGSYIAKVPIPSLQRSTIDCPSMLNETRSVGLTYNATLLMDFVTGNSTSEFGRNNERDIFPLYKVAFQWVPIFGCITVVIVGSISSLLFSFCCKVPFVHQQKISPMVRRIYYKKSAIACNPENSQIKLIFDASKLNIQDIKPEKGQV